MGFVGAFSTSPCVCVRVNGSISERTTPRNAPKGLPVSPQRPFHYFYLTSQGFRFGFGLEV